MLDTCGIQSFRIHAHCSHWRDRRPPNPPHKYPTFYVVLSLPRPRTDRASNRIVVPGTVAEPIGLGRGIRHTRHITRRTLHDTTPTPLPPPPPAPGFGRYIPASIPARLDAGRPHRLFDAHITPHPHGMLIKSIKSITTPLHPPAYQRPAPPPLPPHTAAAAVSATGIGLCVPRRHLATLLPRR